MFKLGSERGSRAINGEIKNKFTFSRESNNQTTKIPGTPVIRKKLDKGIKAEANDDGSIFIDESVVPGSYEERQVLAHEVRHLTEMKIGKLKYDDNSISWDGKEYPRNKGKILYDGEWIPEGSKEFPWEKH